MFLTISKIHTVRLRELQDPKEWDGHGPVVLDLHGEDGRMTIQADFSDPFTARRFREAFGLTRDTEHIVTPESMMEVRS